MTIGKLILELQELLKKDNSITPNSVITMRNQETGELDDITCVDTDSSHNDKYVIVIE